MPQYLKKTWDTFNFLNSTDQLFLSNTKKTIEYINKLQENKVQFSIRK